MLKYTHVTSEFENFELLTDLKNMKDIDMNDYLEQLLYKIDMK